MARLWVHECFRVFSDRLVGERDHETFTSLIGEKLGTIFDLSFNNLCSKQLPIFGDFMKADAVYEDITSFKDLKQFMENSLDDYNNEPGVIAMNLVLFKDAIEHGEPLELFVQRHHSSPSVVCVFACVCTCVCVCVHLL